MESQLRWPSCVKPRGIRTTAITVVGSTWPASTRSGTTHVALISWTVCPKPGGIRMGHSRGLGELLFC